MSQVMVSTDTQSIPSVLTPNAAPNPNSSTPRSTTNISSNVVKRVHREVRFGAYILGSTLGEGEFGKVKLGWRKDGKQPSQVAIKLIKRDSILKDSESEIKIHREINSLKLLNHPNIVNLVEVMKSGKYIGIVLEYASGGELFNYILHHKYLKENVAKKLFAQLISGVDYMHSKGLVHRDLKLENLLLDKHKNVIISDFGFVNSYNRDKNDYMKTSCGSPCYAAPELVLTQSPYEGRKVDIWSLGVILYAMLSGYLPFDDDPENEDGSDIVRLYHYICKTPLTFPEYVSPLARDLLRKIIVPDPKKRININEIRNHPWLSSHANLLSIRQPEWDRIHKENVLSSNPIPPYNQNKRFSMIDARTNSSSLSASNGPSMGANGNTHSRSYSSTSITQMYSQPSTSSSLANAIAIPKVTSTVNNNSKPSISTDSSSTPSPTKPTYVRGHTKSASISNSYPSASIALKAVVDDNKRNSTTSLDSLNQPIFPPPSSKSAFHYPAQIPRSTTYTGTPITTIVESPTKRQDPHENSINSILPLAPLSNRSNNSASSKDSNRLPHSTKKPRPTSFHPSSMSSSLLASGNSSSTGLLDYIKIPSPISIPIPQFLSTSPTKSSPTSECSDLASTQNNSPTGKSAFPSRRNSVVTHVHVNGVLSNENSSNHNSPEHNKRNSVLSYLEDKMDVLDLNDVQSSSPGKVETITPQINQTPTFDTQGVSPTIALDNKRDLKDIPQKEVPVESFVFENDVKEKDLDVIVERVKEKSRETVSSIEREQTPKLKPLEHPLLNKSRESQNNEKPYEKSHRRTRTEPRVDARSELRVSASKYKDANKENIIKETKKRNRFSLLSLYSNYNSSTIDTSTPPPSTYTPRSSGTSPASSTKKILEPSSEINVPPKEQKRIDSSSSSQSKKSNHSNSTSGSSVNGKEASAARKVMDFFKRRSVRIA